jgi:hypothetical protein
LSGLFAVRVKVSRSTHPAQQEQANETIVL